MEWDNNPMTKQQAIKTLERRQLANGMKLIRSKTTRARDYYAAVVLDCRMKLDYVRGL